MWFILSMQYSLKMHLHLIIFVFQVPSRTNVYLISDIHAADYKNFVDQESIFKGNDL